MAPGVSLPTGLSVVAGVDLGCLILGMALLASAAWLGLKAAKAPARKATLATSDNGSMPEGAVP